jgi:triosephosphate isomerase
MPPTVLAGNWKMNTNLAAAVELATSVRDGLGQDSSAQVILCPPFVSLAAVADVVRGSPIFVGAQNMHSQESGAFTGEIAPNMLQGLCDYVILGHSERRQLFGETDGEINLKVQAAFRHGLQPILCVGETLEEREAGRAGDVVETQLRNGLADLVDIRGLIVAYEPVWAIGTGQAATPEIASEIMGGAVQQTLVSLFADTAGNVPLLYGGSVNPGNVAEFAAQDCIHGALVGGASLQAEQFVEVVKQAVLVKSSG